jgi:hypothetical protein
MNTVLLKNEGRLDRTVRIAVGLALLALVFVGPKSLWGLLGFIPLLTGALGTCPLYSFLRLSTCGTHSR